MCAPAHLAVSEQGRGRRQVAVQLAEGVDALLVLPVDFYRLLWLQTLWNQQNTRMHALVLMRL